MTTLIDTYKLNKDIKAPIVLDFVCFLLDATEVGNTKDMRFKFQIMNHHVPKELVDTIKAGSIIQILNVQKAPNLQNHKYIVSHQNGYVYLIHEECLKDCSLYSERVVDTLEKIFEKYRARTLS